MKRIIILLLGIITIISTSFLGCQKDEDYSNKEMSEVSKIEKWFNQNGNNYNALVLDYIGNLEWENAIVSNGDIGRVVEIPFTLKDNLRASNKTADLYNDHHRLMFVEDKDNQFKIYYIQIFTNDKNYDILDSNYNYYNIKDNFDGSIYVQELENDKGTQLNFVDGNLVKPSKTGKMREQAITCVEYGYWYEDGHFESLYTVGCFGGGGGSERDDPGPSYGGGGKNNPIKPDPVINPCDKIKTQMANANFTAKQTELSKNTKLKKETGYLQSRMGPFTPLVSTGNDSMRLPIDANTIGYMHTHLDSYDSGIADPDGNPIMNNPIQMFSPADVKNFILLLVNANKNNIPLSDIYGTMIGSSGTYTLRFEGAYSDLNLGLDFNKDLELKYREIMRKEGKEVGFLKFMKDYIGITGMSLYKINSDGTSAKKTLTTNNKVSTTPCS